MRAKRNGKGMRRVLKSLESRLRRTRRHVDAALTARRLRREAARVDAAALAASWAAAVPAADTPDVIVVSTADGPAGAAACTACATSLARGLLRPRHVAVVAPPSALETLRDGGLADMPATLVPIDASRGPLAAIDAAVGGLSGRHVVVADASATFTDDALLWMAAAIRRRPLLKAAYADDGCRRRAAGEAVDTTDIHHKPDFSWLYLLSRDFLGPWVLYERSLAVAAVRATVDRGTAAASAAAALYAIALEATDGLAAADVVHVAQPLAFLPAGEPSSRGSAERPAIAAAALQARGTPADVERHPRDGRVNRFRFHRRHSPSVSIVIPTKNAGELVAACVDSVRRRPGYERYDVTVIDHDSDEPALLDFLDRERRAGRLRVHRHSGPFNFAAMNNAAIRTTGGELVLLLNNDVRDFSDDWLDQLVATIDLDPRIAAVGPLLFYPDGDIQHAGVTFCAKRMCQHPYRFAPPDATGYQGRIVSLQEYAAVTAAMMLVRRSAFEQVGGFDEVFPDDYNDIDLCLRLRAAGHRIAYTPHVHAAHWEGRTRTAQGSARDVFRARWADFFPRDPFVPPFSSAANLEPNLLEPLWEARKKVALDAFVRGAIVAAAPPRADGAPPRATVERAA